MSQGIGMHPAVMSSADRGEIDLSALMREIGRKKWFVLGFTLAAAILSIVAVNMLKPKYTAETRVLIESRDSDYTRVGREGGRASEPAIDQDAILSQVQLMTSRDIARAMIERFDLGSNREFDKIKDGVDAVTRIAVMLGIMDNPARVSPQDRVLDSYYDKLKVFSMAKSRVIAIEFQSRDPELAAKLTNAIAEEYIRQLEGAKKGTAQSAGSWLNRTIDPLRQRVAQAEARVEAFRNQTGLFSSGDAGTISTQQLSELNTQLATARSQQGEQASKARAIREAVRQGRIFEVSDVVNNEVVRRLIESRATLKAQIAQEERTLLPQHPRIKELHAQLVGLEDQVRAAAERVARALENDARTAGARVVAAQAELDQQKRQAGSANENEVQLRALEREAKAEREQLETYLARYRDASVRDAENAVAADARVVSRSTAPSSPTFPKRLPIIVISTLGAFTLALFWVMTRALLSDAIYSRRPDAVYAPAMAGMPSPFMMPGHYPAMPYPYPYMPHPAGFPQMAPDGAQQHAAQSAPASAFVPPAPKQDVVKVPEMARQAAPSTVKARLEDMPLEPMQPPRQTRDLQQSLDRMKEALAAAPVVAAVAAPIIAKPEAPVVNVAPATIAPAPAAAPRAPEVKPATDVSAKELLAPVVVAESAPARAPAAVSAPVVTAPTIEDAPALADLDPYDPLAEIAEEAVANLKRDRPVSILFLSIKDHAFAASSVALLQRHLAGSGLSMTLTLDDSTRKAANIASVLKRVAGDHDFVILNAGYADEESANLSRATTLTVLVAAEELDDSRTDMATQRLSGCNYFIVSPAGDSKVTA